MRRDGLTDNERHDQGMALRRTVLGPEYVDRATANATEFTADYHDFITRASWGDVWSRPGLDLRSRSIAAITSLIAHGHRDELVLHIRGALNNGVTVDEIKEVIMQAGIFSGFPAALGAFRIANEFFESESLP